METRSEKQVVKKEEAGLPSSAMFEADAKLAQVIPEFQFLSFLFSVCNVAVFIFYSPLAPLAFPIVQFRFSSFEFSFFRDKVVWNQNLDLTSLSGSSKTQTNTNG